MRLAGDTLELPDLWIWSTEVSDRLLGELTRLLSHVEISRVANYRNDDSKKQFIIARAGLRILLSKYLKTSPLEVDLTYERFGKPVVKTADIHFNISHSRDFIVAAVHTVAVGIDIETSRQNFNVSELAPTVLQDAEFADIQGQLEDHQNQQFMKYWTAKEAYLKCTGSGFQSCPKELLMDPSGGFVIRGGEAIPYLSVQMQVFGMQGSLCFPHVLQSALEIPYVTEKDFRGLFLPGELALIESRAKPVLARRHEPIPTFV